jgi:hypothetical protein
LPDVGVTAIRETWTASCGDITPRSWLLRTHSSLPFGSPLLPPKPRSRSLCRFATSPCCRRDLPDVSSANPSLGAWAPATSVRGVHMPVSSSTSSAFPRTLSRSAFPLVPVQTISRRIPFSRLQPFLYVQAPKFAHLPDRLTKSTGLLSMRDVGHDVYAARAWRGIQSGQF